MPSKNPRLSVVLSPALASTLSQLSEETGESASGLVRGLLEQTQPALARMLDLLRAAKRAKGQISGGLGGVLDRVVSDLEEASDLADLRMSRATRDLVDTAEEVKGRRRRAGSRRAGAVAPEAPSTPGPVTRGSGGAQTGQDGGRRPGQSKGRPASSGRS